MSNEGSIRNAIAPGSAHKEPGLEHRAEPNQELPATQQAQLTTVQAALAKAII